MTILRSILSVVLGFVAMVILVMVGTALIMLATGVTMQGPPTPLYLLLNVALSPVAGAAGGWACRRLAPVNPARHVWVLVFVVVALGLMSALHPEPGQPAWYCWVVPLLGGAGVALGGRAWLRPQGAAEG